MQSEGMVSPLPLRLAVITFNDHVGESFAISYTVQEVRPGVAVSMQHNKWR